MSNKRYLFKIVYLKNSVFLTHREEKSFRLFSKAHQHFRSLLDKFKVDGGSYYLCEWGEI